MVAIDRITCPESTAPLRQEPGGHSTLRAICPTTPLALAGTGFPRRQASVLSEQLAGLGSARLGGLLAPGAVVAALDRRLEGRNQMLLAVTDKIGAAHFLERLAQHRPVVGIVITQECLVQTTLLLTFDDAHLFGLVTHLAQRVLA